MPEPAHAAQPVTGQLPPCLAVIDVTPDGDRTHVRMHGELDLGGRRLQPQLHEALNHARDGIDLHLDTLEFCDCAGFNILLDLRRRALKQGKTVVVRSTSPPVERLLDLTGARELFTPADLDKKDTTDTGPSQEKTGSGSLLVQG